MLRITRALLANSRVRLRTAKAALAALAAHAAAQQAAAAAQLGTLSRVQEFWSCYRLLRSLGQAHEQALVQAENIVLDPTFDGQEIVLVPQGTLPWP